MSTSNLPNDCVIFWTSDNQKVQGQENGGTSKSELSCARMGIIMMEDDSFSIELSGLFFQLKSAPAHPTPKNEKNYLLQLILWIFYKEYWILNYPFS